VAATHLRQGMLESSTVALGDEMVATMTALRQADAGGRVMQVWDDLMGRAVTTFGQAGR
jgi:flagellar basal-body rod protein FlgG